MQSDNYEHLVLEFKDFIARPPAYRNPVELLNLLRRIFPLVRVPTCDSVTSRYLCALLALVRSITH
jgi:hypothetical protein